MYIIACMCARACVSSTACQPACPSLEIHTFVIHYIELYMYIAFFCINLEVLLLTFVCLFLLLSVFGQIWEEIRKEL